jgi:Protein of unknown function (DUF3822)
MTEKVTLEITDKRFQQNNALSYEFSLLIGTDGMSYLSADESGEVLVLKSWSFINPDNKFREVEAPIRSIFANDANLSLSFGKPRVAVFNNLVTLVPNRLFNSDELPSYFNLLIAPDTPLSYRYNDIKELDAKVVFALDKSIAGFLEQNYPNTQFFHSASTLLRAWHSLAKRNDFEVFVNLRNQIAQIAVFDRRNLQFYNSFAFSKASDFLYFTLLTFDQLKLNPLDVPLTISGELMEDSEIYRLLFRYFRDIRFTEIPAGLYQFPGSIQSLPGHLNFDLYAMKLV